MNGLPAHPLRQAQDRLRQGSPELVEEIRANREILSEIKQLTTHGRMSINWPKVIPEGDILEGDIPKAKMKLLQA